MKNIIFILLFIFQLSFSQIKIVSWNIENLGKSKSDSTIVFIANTIKEYDVVVIQEVVAGYGGSQAVAKLSDQLNRLGEKWDYTINLSSINKIVK